MPGSTGARVGPFIDQLLAVDSAANQRAFLGALGAFDMVAINRHGTAWIGITPSQQDALLREASTADARSVGLRRALSESEGLDRRRVLLVGDRHARARMGRQRRPCAAARVHAPRRPPGLTASARITMQTTRFDVIVVGSGASGGWAAKRLSEAGIKVALLEAGKPQGGADFSEHVPAYDLTVSRSGERVDPPHAPAAARLLCLPRVELQVVRQRSRRALHHAGRQAVQLAGPHARRRRPHQRLGPAVVPVQRSGSARQVVRRIRRGLADLLQGSGAVLRARRGLRRHLGTGRERAGAARQPLPSGDADELRGDAAAHARQEQAWLDGDDRPRGQHHAAASTGAAPATTAGPASRAA